MNQNSQSVVLCLSASGEVFTQNPEMKPEQLMGLFIIPITLSGTICNWLIVFAISSNKSLKHSFSLLTGTQAALNGTFSALYLMYIAPMIILNNHFLMDHSEHVGLILVICYDSSIQIHAIITVNRFCAVFFPLLYNKIFDTKKTSVIILVSCGVSLAVIITFFKILPCRAVYVEQIVGFTYSDAPICLTYSYYLDMFKLTSLCVFNIVGDTITIWKVRKVRSAQGMTKFQKKEIDFLKQSLGQAIYLMICIPSWYIIPMFNTTNVIVQFILGVVFWPMIHSFDGVFTLYFNVEIRKTLTRKFRKPTATVNHSMQFGGKSSTRMN